MPEALPNDGTRARVCLHEDLCEFPSPNEHWHWQSVSHYLDPHTHRTAAVSC